MVSASLVPAFRVLVGGLEPRCSSCNGVLPLGESVYCLECRSVARKRALAVLTVGSPHPRPVGAA